MQRQNPVDLSSLAGMPSIDAIQAPRDALVYQALQRIDISQYLDDGDFVRQARLAADRIVSRYSGKETDERIVQGVVKTANAIRTRVKVFVSYKEKYEQDAKVIVKILRERGAAKLDVWYARDIPPGDDWMQALFERITSAHWFLLLLPDCSENLGWQLYEAGIFKASMLPGDRLFCLHHASVQRAPQLDDYQAVLAERDDLSRLLNNILVEPNAVPGMDPINPHVQDQVPDLAGQIAAAFDRLSAPKTVRFGHFIELAVDNARELTCARDLDHARIIGSQGVEELFGRQDGVDQTWGTLISDLDPQDTSWITELVNVMREVAEGSLPGRVEATFAGANAAAGKRFRPQMTSAKRKAGSVESFHVHFTASLEPGAAGGEPESMRSMQTALRLAYRLRWEIIEGYKNKYAFDSKDIRTISNVLERLTSEARYHGLLDRESLCAQFGHDAHRVDAMFARWEEIHNPLGTGLLDQGLAQEDDEKLRKALQALEQINKQFMLMATKRFADMVSAEW